MHKTSLFLLLFLSLNAFGFDSGKGNASILSCKKLDFKPVITASFIKSKMQLKEDTVWYQPKPVIQTLSSFGTALGYGIGTFSISFVAAETFIFKWNDFFLGASLVSLPFAMTAHTFGAAYGCYMQVSDQGGNFKYALQGALIGMGASIVYGGAVIALANATNISEFMYLFPAVYIIPSVVTTWFYNKKYQHKPIVIYN